MPEFELEKLYRECVTAKSENSWPCPDGLSGVWHCFNADRRFGLASRSYSFARNIWLIIFRFRRRQDVDKQYLKSGSNGGEA